LRATDLARQALALWADDSGTPTVGPYGRVFTDLLTIRVEGELVALETGAAGGNHFDGGLLDSLRDAVRQRPADERLTALMMRAWPSTDARLRRSPHTSSCAVSSPEPSAPTRPR